MAENNVSLTVHMKIITDECGLVYLVPNWMPSYSYVCPACAARRIQNLEEKIIVLQNSVRGLKGENAKLKGKLECR